MILNSGSAYTAEDFRLTAVSAVDWLHLTTCSQPATRTERPWHKLQSRN